MYLYLQIKTLCVIQIHGIKPFGIVYVAELLLYLTDIV